MYIGRNSPSARLNSLQLTTGDSVPKKRDRASESHDRKTGTIKRIIPNKWLGIFPTVHPSFIAYIIAIQEVAFSVSSILYKSKTPRHPSFNLFHIAIFFICCTSSNFFFGCFSVRACFSSLAISFSIFCRRSSAAICSSRVLPSAMLTPPISTTMFSHTLSRFKPRSSMIQLSVGFQSVYISLVW